MEGKNERVFGDKVCLLKSRSSPEPIIKEEAAVGGKGAAQEAWQMPTKHQDTQGCCPLLHLKKKKGTGTMHYLVNVSS